MDINLKEIDLAGLAVYAQRLSTYYKQLLNQREQILKTVATDQAIAAKIGAAPLIQEINEELTKIKQPMEAVNKEMNERMKKDLGIKLSLVELSHKLNEFGRLYSEHKIKNQN